MPTSQRIAQPTPLRGAAVLTAVYLLVGSAWIVASSLLAATQVGDGAYLVLVEVIKGLAFVVVTGLVLFGGLFWLLRRQAELARVATAWRDATAEAERHAIAGVVAASVGHDINNIIMILDAEEEPDARRRGLERLTALARRLQQIGREDDLEDLVELDLREVVGEMVRFVRGHERLRGRDLVVTAPERVQVRLPRLLFERALLNVLLNAGEATGVGGRVRLYAGVEGGRCVVVVEDSGPGLPADPGALMQPGITTRTRGSGLGLLPLQALAQRLDAEVVLARSASLGGARVGLIWRA